MLRNAKTLESYELQARDGTIGHVEDLFFDDREWRVRYLVANTGTWLESRKVLISPAAVSAPQWDAGLLPINLTREQVENGPRIDPQQPVSREHEAALVRYYNWPAYWGAAGFPDAGFGLLPIVPELAPRGVGDPEAAARQASPDPTVTAVLHDHHTRSMRAVTGHLISASDGKVGHVDDFLIDDASWRVRFLVVDTRNWWPGKRVLIAPEWIDSVGWEDAKVFARLTREAIKTSPEYDPEKAMTAEASDALHAHYGPRARGNEAPRDGVR